MEKPKSLFRKTWFLIASFLLLTLLIFVTGHFYYLKEKADLRAEHYRYLAAIADYKVWEIRNWMDERRAEGLFLQKNSSLLRTYNILRTKPSDSESYKMLGDWINPIRENHRYRCVCFYDPAGAKIAEYCDSSGFCSPDHPPFTGPGPCDSIRFSRYMRDQVDGTGQLSYSVPLWYLGKYMGSAVFWLDPDEYLLPLVTTRHSHKESAENLLIHREGDSLVYLSEMPLRSGIKNEGNIPPASDQIARMVPVSGTLAMAEGKDYRGVDVMAEIRKIPGTHWSLISKVDLAEIYSPLKNRAVKIILYMLTFMLVAIVSSLLIWKNQQLNYYRSQVQMQTQSEIAEEKIRFMNALLQGVNDAIITFDKDLMIQSWNKGAERIYGWSAEEVVGKFGGGSLRVDFPGTTRETVMNELEKSGSWKGEVVHKRKDGSTVYLLSTTSRLYDEDGNMLGIITINKDISEVVQSEKAKNAVYRISELAHSARDLDEMFGAIHVVIGELMDARNLYIALLSQDGGAISFPYYVDEKDSPPPPQPFGHGLTEHVMRTGKPLLARPEDIEYLIENGMIDLSGTPAIDWLGVPLKSEKETIGALVLQSYSRQVRYGEREKDILIFVSEQIALSIQRKKIQQELIEAKQKAEVSSKLTSALLANMNHELRTPMNGILGFAEILLNELTDPDAQVKAENILVSGRRLMDTLDAIMDLSYLESDQVSRKFKPVSIQKIFRSVFSTYEPLIKRKRLAIFQTIPQDAMILGDEHLFKHLIKNLVDNAVKYTESGNITVEVTPRTRDEQPFYSIAVRDTGIGISPENHRMIFEAFRQVSEGYGRQFEGSGLGLTLGKKIVNLMHGEISLSSVMGEGSVFTVLLPAVIPARQLQHLSASRLTEPSIHPASAGAMPDVLLVEDNLVNLQLLMVYIRDFCNVYSALDAKAAIQMTRERLFHAILMDINLGPGMDGIQAMLEIRKRTEYQHVPIIALTGYASIGDQERLTSIGFNSYLPKPYDRDNIAALMEELFPSA